MTQQSPVVDLMNMEGDALGSFAADSEGQCLGTYSLGRAAFSTASSQIRLSKNAFWLEPSLMALHQQLTPS